MVFLNGTIHGNQNIKLARNNQTVEDEMKNTSVSNSSGFTFWGIILISFFCMVIVSNRPNGDSVDYAMDVTEIAQSYPAEHSYHRIDLTSPEQSFLPVW